MRFQNKKFTKQEKVVAELIAFGFSEKEIAVKLFIAESTVHTHAKNIRKKINARSAVDVARFYIVENPAKFFATVLFLILQNFMVFTSTDFDGKIFRVGRKSQKIRKYEII